MIRICPRFSLRTATIIWTLLLILVAYFGKNIREARQQQTAVAKMEAAGVSISYEETDLYDESSGDWIETPPSWLEQMFGYERS